MQHRKGFRSPPKSPAVDPHQKKFHVALALHQQGNVADAKRLYDEILTENPRHFDALYLSGGIAQQARRLDEAERFFAKAASVRSDFAPLHFNYGNALTDMNRLEDAVLSYDKAISIKPDHAEAFNSRAAALMALKRLDEALASFDKAIAIKPDYAEAFNNRGAALQRLKRYDEALASFDRAIAIRPDYANAFLNRGNALKDLKRLDEALASYDQAIAFNPNHAEIFNNRGNALKDLGRLDEAVASYHRALTLKPSCEWVFGSWLHGRMQTSDWTGFDSLTAQLKAALLERLNIIDPFQTFGLIDDPAAQRLAAQIYVKQRFPYSPVTQVSGVKSGGKIRIGYYSSDFHNHATAHLMAELFERHDRDQFETFGFSFGPVTGDDMEARLKKSFDHFIDTRFKSDREIAEASQALGIDIALDLKGFTHNSRTGIFAHRCAPVQVNYIGYPGTMGADYIDYIIADHTLIPAEQQPHYSEKVVYLPNSYQVNDSHRKISDRAFTRAELGLPQSGFVFCCFNNNYKIVPTVFDAWMRTLKAVDGSVLWLLEDNATSARNLKREAASRGVSPDRLVFARRMPLADHLARHRSADLFLDTLPCNAHTTASDALWAGLPVLTHLGEAFAGRVAASLLNAIGLPDLIAETAEHYERTAIRLATHPDEIAALKQRLAANRLTSKLFDTPLYVTHLEAAYKAMHARAAAGLAPDHIHIAP